VFQTIIWKIYLAKFFARTVQSKEPANLLMQQSSGSNRVRRISLKILLLKIIIKLII